MREGIRMSRQGEWVRVRSLCLRLRRGVKRGAILTAAVLAFAFAAPGDAQAAVITVMPSGGGAEWTLAGEQYVKPGQTYTYTLTRAEVDDLPTGEKFGIFTTSRATDRFKFGTSGCTGVDNYFCLSVTNSGTSNEFTAGGNFYAAYNLNASASSYVLTLRIGTSTPLETKVNIGLVSGSFNPRPNPLTLTVSGDSARPPSLTSNLSNTTDAGSGVQSVDVAQLFHTGDRRGGYTVTSIVVGSGNSNSFEVELCGEDGTGHEHPNTDCTDFTAPSMFASGDVVFTHSGVPLAPGTNYVVVIRRSGTSVYPLATLSGDQTGRSNWSIKDRFYWFSGGGWHTGSVDRALKIAVRGSNRSNTAATGTPTISGTARGGEVLTAAKGSIADIDGVPDTFTYQWVRVDGGDETDIPNATSSTYTLGLADEGKQVRVRVSFTDKTGNAEARTSDAYPSGGTVEARPNTAATGAPVISGFARQGATLSAEKGTIDDTDGLTSPTFTYQWIRVDGGREADIPNATSSDYIPVAADVGKKVKVTLSFNDDYGTLESRTSEAFPAEGAIRVNSPATGKPTIAGNFRVGKTLTATLGSIADPDGISDTRSYQWIRVDGGRETNIRGATGRTYTLAAADRAKKVKVTLSFIDNFGSRESRTSDVWPSATIADEITLARSLVSNLGQSQHGATWLENIDLAQSFTTGGNAHGYALTGLDLRLKTEGSQTTTPTVKLFRGSPHGTRVATLAGPSALDARRTKTYRFTPSTPLTLLPSTSYWVVVEGGHRGLRWSKTPVDDEDPTPAAGWRISSSGQWRWATSTGYFVEIIRQPFMLRINGTVRVSEFPDNAGTSGSNSPAQGKPTVGGTARVGEGLYATQGTVADPDGLPEGADAFTWQWIRVDGGTATDISGADSSSYTLVAADQGKTVKAKISFTDNGGNTESVESDPWPSSGTVAAAGGTGTACGAPTLTDRTILWVNTINVADLGGAGSPYGYSSLDSKGSLTDSANTSFKIGESASYTVLEIEVYSGQTLYLQLAKPFLPRDELPKLKMHVCDDEFAFSAANSISSDHGNLLEWANSGFTWSSESTRTVYITRTKTDTAPAPTTNFAATGKPTISGTAQVEHTLTAAKGTIADPEGVPNAFTYQWIRVDGARETEIRGATASTYRLVAADGDKQIKVRVSFDDDDDHPESRTSDAWPASGAVAPRPSSLVSNVGQTRSSRASPFNSMDMAQAFTTGSHAGGYRLTGIGLMLKTDGSPSAPTVKIFRDSANGTEVARLTGPSRLDANTVKIYDFTASGTVTLAASTEYWVVGEGGSGVRWHQTRSDGEDANAAAGASIANTGQWRLPGRTWSFSDMRNGVSFMLRVDGDNSTSMGQPTISGTAREGETLTAAMGDVGDATDGRQGTLTYQWIRVDGSNETDIPGAASNTYTLATADRGKKVKVRASFADGAGYTESRNSDAYPSAGVIDGICAAPDLAGRRQIWSGTVNVATIPVAHHYWRGWITIDGRKYGSLSGARTIRIGSRDHEVVGAWVRHDSRPDNTNEGRLTFRLNRPLSVSESAQLHVCDRTFAFSARDGTYPNARYYWLDTGLDWRTYPTRTLRLSVPGRGGGQSAEPDPPTARFDSVPSDHDGSSPIKFQLHFSQEPEDLSYTTVGGALLDVTSGTVTGARRLTAQDNSGWEVSAQPSGNADVVITLPNRACNEANAVCIGGQPLAAEVIVTIPGPEQETEPLPPFTAAFAGRVPTEHDGSTNMEFEFHLSHDPGHLGYETVRDDLFTVTGGTIENAWRRTQGAERHMHWNLRVKPTGDGDVTIALNATVDCAGTPGVCRLADGAKLDSYLRQTIKGPATLSVADATVEEAQGATLDFVVTLSRTRFGATTVQYATSDGTATEGSDYTATSGTLTFGLLKTSRTVSVPVLNDPHEDGGETVTLTLSNPTPSAYVRISDGTATGTITNTDPMPQAWLARFGRTVGEQALEAVEARMAASRAPGFSGSVGGASLPGVAGAAPEGEEAPGEARSDAREGFEALAGWLGGKDRGKEAAALESRTRSGTEVLAGTSFQLTGGTAGSGSASFWGRGAVTRFDGREGDLSLDGEVVSAMAGADFSADALLGGVMVSHSRGDGGYRSPAGDGAVSSTLTGVFPYGRYTLSDRLSVWGMAGYGAGTLALTPEGQAAMRPDMDLMMGAAGVRGVLLEGGGAGPTLAAKSDAMAVRTSTGRVPGLRASEAKVTRLRLALEGSRPIPLGRDALLTPSLEVGVRHDGGDAETGFGADVGAGLALWDPARGLSAELRARGLLTHEADGVRESGVSGTLSFDPAPDTERGISLQLTQTLGGPSAGGAAGLITRPTLAGLGAEEADDGLRRRRLDARLAYGLGVFGERWTAVPELGLGLSRAERDVRLGWRLTRTAPGETAFDLGAEARRLDQLAGGDGPDHEVGIGIGWRRKGTDAGTLAFETRVEATRRDPANDKPDHGVWLTASAHW